MNFCPNCGADCSAMHRPKRTSVSDREVLEYRIEKALAAGWELETDEGDHAVMVRRDFGTMGAHFFTALFTFALTLGAGNALLALYCYYVAAERIVLWPDYVDTAGTSSSARSSSGSHSQTIASVLLLWLAIAFAIGVSLLVSSPLVAGLLYGVAFALALTAVGLLPPVRARLANRRSLTDFGWVRSVEEEAITAPDEPCTSCGCAIEEGVARTYQKEFALFGVPLTTDRGGTNHYCRRCLQAEFEPSTVADETPGLTDSASLESTTEPSLDAATARESTETDAEPERE
ncbi:hypothetical protein GCM10025298_29420 [Natronobiforma cellulositropha]